MNEEKKIPEVKTKIFLRCYKCERKLEGEFVVDYDYAFKANYLDVKFCSYCTGKDKLPAANLIELERRRQIEEEGYSDSHDDQHMHGELAIVASSLLVDGTDAMVVDKDGFGTKGDEWGLIDKHGYRAKPDGRLRKLVIAGALVVAEIEREMRKKNG